jgi:hypothetical protein
MITRLSYAERRARLRRRRLERLAIIHELRSEARRSGELGLVHGLPLRPRLV